MREKQKTNFLLKRIHSDGTANDPRIYSLEDLEGDWRMGRRGFLLASAAALSLAGGCESGNDPENKKRKKAVLEAEKKHREMAEHASRGEKAGKRTSNEKPLVKEESGCKGVPAHGKAVDRLAFSSDGKYLVSGSKEDTKLWEIPSGTLVETLEKKGSDRGEIAVSPADMVMAVIRRRGIHFYSIPSMKVMREYTPENPRKIETALFCDDGKTMVIGSNDGTLSVYSPQWDEVSRIMAGQTKGKIYSLALARGGRILAAGKHDCIEIWDIATGELAAILRHGRDPATLLAFDPLSIFLVSKSRNEKNRVRLWDIAAQKTLATIQTELAVVRDATFDPDGRLVISGSRGNPEIWNIPSGTLHGKPEDLDKTVVISFHPDAALMAAGTSDGRISIRDVADRKIVSCLFDQKALSSKKRASTYTYRDKYGREIATTQPCGSPTPAGSICTCNCVPGKLIFRTKSSICTCDQVCTCVPMRIRMK